MPFEWDTAKAAANFAKHGVSFIEAARIFEGPILEQEDNRRDYGERRIIAYGKCGRKILAVVYTMRSDNRRIITARRASRDEREDYRRERG
ncbi:MAG: BrnT family toxin [Candidatus Binataceae bacterium]